MQDATFHMRADQWMRTLFSAQAAQRGGVIRRAAADVDRIVGRKAFLEDLGQRGYHAVENSGQIVIFCNNRPVRILR